MLRLASRTPARAKIGLATTQEPKSTARAQQPMSRPALQGASRVSRWPQRPASQAGLPRRPNNHPSQVGISKASFCCSRNEARSRWFGLARFEVRSDLEQQLFGSAWSGKEARFRTSPLETAWNEARSPTLRRRSSSKREEGDAGTAGGARGDGSAARGDGMASQRRPGDGSVAR